MTKELIIIFSLLISIVGFSQEDTQSFSLQEAIDYALENNRSAKNAARNIESAKQRKWETTATGLPQISAKIEYNNWLKQQVSLIPAEFFGGNQGEFAEVAFGTTKTMNATATLEQLLFDGSYLVGLQSAKVFLEISKNAKEKTDLEIRKAVINAYGNVLLAQESVSILKNNKAVLEKNLYETQKIYENGLTEEEDVEQLQITLSSINNSLNQTKRLKNLAIKMFNITLGNDINTNTILTEDLNQLTITHIDLGLITIEENVESTIDYKIAKNDKRSKELLLKLEKSKALPSLSAFINGSYAGNSENFTFLKNEQKWFGSSLMGVSLNIPIFSSFGRHAATQRAKIELEKSEDNLTETEQQLKLLIATGKSNYEFAIQQYETAKQNLNLAQRIEKKNQTKFFEGISTSFDLRQAQTQLYTSQQDYLQAMLNVITKKAELETILNTIN
ncbi:MAG: TolC family protein [Bacteroidetes bacterium]|nr:MAG: TolC family protein [Bacteroidota bacterium]